MTKLKLLLFVPLLALSVLHTEAQKLSENTFHSRYTYVFRLDSSQLRMFNQNIRLDSSFYLTHTVGRFHNDSQFTFNIQSYGWGTYLYVSAYEAKVSYRVVKVAPFYTDIWGADRRNAIIVKDLQGNIITNATVSLMHGVVCPYNAGIGSYALPHLRHTELVKIEHEGRFEYVYVNPSYYEVPPPKPTYPDYSHTHILAGYLVFNQPRFKHYDTLKFKAFLLNDNAKPYIRKISVYLRENYNKERLIGHYKAATPGAYFGEMLIPDTLSAGRSYEIIFRDVYGEIIKSGSFYIDNYELKQNRYHVNMPSNNITPGTPVTFTAEAKDANNLPVMDGSIRINVRITNINTVLQDRLFIPDAWYQSFYAIEKEFDPSGYTIFTLPDSLFTKFNANYAIHIRFLNADNELASQTLNFTYNNISKTYSITYDGDSLHVNAYIKGQASERHLKLITKFSTGIIQTSEITTPHIRAADPAAVSYFLYDADTLLHTYNVPNSYSGEISVYGQRRADSIFINIDNPSRVPVYYEIYKKSERIEGGTTTNLRFSRADISQESYYIIWSHNTFGNLKQNFRIKSFHLFEKRLNVSLDQPEEIYPGQTVNVAVRVADQWNKGVGNVNLTAYSVNNQFDNIPLPEVPYMGLVKNDIPIHFTSPTLHHSASAYTFTIAKQHIDALHLFDNELYRFLYGKGGKTVSSIPVSSPQPQLAAYVYKQHRLQDIVYIKVDKTIVYHRNHMLHEEYAFKVPAGVHDISVRTFDQLLTWEKFMFTDSTKSVICFNLDTLKPAADTARAYPGKLSSSEWQDYLNCTLFLHIDNSYDSITVRQKSYLAYFNAHSSSAGRNHMLNIAIDKDHFMAIGPVRPGPLTVKQYGQYSHEFSYEPGTAYYMNASEVRPFTINTFPEYLKFFGSDLINSQYNLYSFQQLATDPDIIIPIDSSGKHENEITIEEPDRIMPYIERRSYNRYNINQGRINIINHTEHDILYSWLMHRREDSASVIRNDGLTNISYYDTGRYDLLVFDDSNYCVIKDLAMPLSGTFYLFLKPSYFKPIDYREIWPYERVVKELTVVPMRPFTDTPYIIQPVVIDKKSVKGKNARLSGKVIDARFNTPIDYAEILAEIQGYFKGGAVSNEDGDFVFENLPPGTYMLKLRVPDYRYQVIYNLKLNKGMETVIKIRLFHVQDNIYETEDNIAVSHGYGAGEGHDPGPPETHPEYAPAMQKASKTSIAYERHYTDQVVTYNATGSVTNILSGADMITKLQGVTVSAAADKNNEDGFGSINPELMMQRLNSLAATSQANRIRDRFRDCGYWVPNLVTDKNGMSYYTVTFPDNITSWKTMVPAMNGNRQSGMATMLTRSYKPLSGNMAAPYFITEGDRLYLKGRVLNYTGRRLPMQLRFSINDSVIMQHNDSADRVLMERVAISGIKAGDTLNAAFSLSMANGYLDGEERQIPVQTKGILIANSTFADLDGDTTMQYIVDRDAYKAYVLIHNSDVERLMQEIQDLKGYSYGCTEQTTSKLRALLVEKAICKALNIPFKEDKMVKQMIAKLQKMRNRNGTWGWWENSSEDLWLTMYACKTLNDARLAGYSNNVYIKAASTLEKELPNMHVHTQLYALNLLKDMDRDVAYDTFVKHQNTGIYNSYDWLLYTRLLQKLGKPYSISRVTSLVHTGGSGGLYWGDHIYNYQQDMASSTLLAYEILKHNDTGKQYLKPIKQFFNSNNFTRHTLARAGLITLQAEDWEQQRKQGNAITGDVAVNGYHLLASDFPYKKRFSAGDTIRISHSGNRAHATIVTQKVVVDPQPDSTYYSISSTLNGKHDSIKLKAGEPVTLQVRVEAFRSADQVMVEIPLPAGFSYASKPDAYGMETHREYFYNKTSIFCSNMPRGIHTFSISVIPKFNGSMTMPPAKVELMYYPEIHNNEVPKKVEVE